MAGNEKPAAPAPAPDGAAPAAPRKKGGLKMIIAAVAVVVLEVATVGITAKMAGGPRPVTADTPVPPKLVPVERDVEVKLLAERLPNSLSGRQFLYDLQVVVKVSDKDKTKVTELFTERDAEIRDQIRTIIASSDPNSLTEPGLETLRRKISYQLELLVGKDLLKEVLIPKCTPIPPAF